MMNSNVMRYALLAASVNKQNHLFQSNYLAGLVALGLYEPMMRGLSDMNFPVLAACLPGMLLAMLVLARVMTWLLRRHHALVFHGILGVVAASTLVIVPVKYTGWREGLASAVCCLAGFGLALFLERLDRTLPR